MHALVAVFAHQQVLSLLTLTAAEEEEVRGRRKGRGRRRNSPFITDYAGLTVVAGPTAMARLDTPETTNIVNLRLDVVFHTNFSLFIHAPSYTLSNPLT